MSTETRSYQHYDDRLAEQQRRLWRGIGWALTWLCAALALAVAITQAT
jgi:hypothetical protein